MIIENDEKGEQWTGYISNNNNQIVFDAQEGIYTISVVTSDGECLYGGFEI